MTGTGFILEPHPQIGAPPPVRITGGIRFHSNTLFVHFQLDGRVEEVRLPPYSRILVRRGRLWEETCFEFFIGMTNSLRYWEFNLSPSGDWNVFRFWNYREGMQEETAFHSLPIRVQQGIDVFLLSAECDLEKILPSGRGIEAGISAVIQSNRGELSHWALTHSADRPDFHRRDAFLIEL
jgi:hypothetical protein